MLREAANPANLVMMSSATDHFRFDCHGRLSFQLSRWAPLGVLVGCVAVGG